MQSIFDMLLEHCGVLVCQVSVASTDRGDGCSRRVDFASLEKFGEWIC